MEWLSHPLNSISYESIRILEPSLAPKNFPHLYKKTLNKVSYNANK